MKRILVLSALLALPSISSAQETCPSGSPAPTCDEHTAIWTRFYGCTGDLALCYDDLMRCGTDCYCSLGEFEELTSLRDEMPKWRARAWKAEGAVRWYDAELKKARSEVSALRAQVAAMRRKGCRP